MIKFDEVSFFHISHANKASSTSASFESSSLLLSTLTLSSSSSSSLSSSSHATQDLWAAAFFGFALKSWSEPWNSEPCLVFMLAWVSIKLLQPFKALFYIDRKIVQNKSSISSDDDDRTEARSSWAKIKRSDLKLDQVLHDILLQCCD